MNQDKNQNVCDQGTPQSVCVSRQDARALLKDIIFSLRQRAKDLETLSNMLPAEPTHEQEQALWNVVIQLGNR